MKIADKKTNFFTLDKKYSSIDNSRAFIIPVLFSENRKAKSLVVNAPKEIIKASSMLESYDEEMGGELCYEKGICTFEILNLQKNTYQKACEKLEKEITPLLAEDKTIVTLGGSHAISYGAIKAFSDKYDSLSVLHIDSKANLKKDWQGKTEHDTLMARVARLNKKIVQVGIRSQSKEENDFRLEKQIHQYLACEIKLGIYGTDWQELVNKDLSDNVYITIDLSGFDPSIINTVENPEPGGLFWDEIIYLFKIIGQDRNIVGFDVMGFVPNSTSSFPYYFVVKLIYKILNYALSKN